VDLITRNPQVLQWISNQHAQAANGPAVPAVAKQPVQVPPGAGAVPAARKLGATGPPTLATPPSVSAIAMQAAAAKKMPVQPPGSYKIPPAIPTGGVAPSQIAATATGPQPTNSLTTQPTQPAGQAPASSAIQPRQPFKFDESLAELLRELKSSTGSHESLLPISSASSSLSPVYPELSSLLMFHSIKKRGVVALSKGRTAVDKFGPFPFEVSLRPN